MKAKLLIATALLFTISISSADAQIRKHERHQHTRIKEGVKSGELTRAETKNLAQDQRAIRSDVRNAKADGVVTSKERRKIRKEQRKESREIYRKKHNERERH